MEKLPIKLNDLSPIIIELIGKIQSLDTDFLTKEQKLNRQKELTEEVDNFRHFFIKALGSINHDEHTRIFSEKIERAFSQFEWVLSMGLPPFEYKKHVECAKTLISSIIKVLGTKGCGILITETYLKVCLKVIAQMSATAEKSNSSSDISNFKLLLDGFLTTVNMLKKYWHISFLPSQKTAIILCLSQICKGLHFLLEMIKVNNKYLINFALNMIEKCLNKVVDLIHCEENLQSTNGQEFITLMDLCLFNLNELSDDVIDLSSFIEKANNTILTIKPMTDEILCYVMCIAQVTHLEKDKAAITASAQKVLREFNDLDKNVKEEDRCGIKLNATSLIESLCSLERHVNSAVLLLVLEVFSGINCPLKNIVNKCRADIEKDNKASEDLNVLISAFDTELDKIMQIGLFAIACTTDVNNILGIRSCLASLECLETELVPCVTAMYVDCSTKNKTNFKHLSDFWLKEITELKILIDSVMDPCSFCEIVENQIKSLLLTIKDITSSNEYLNKAKSVFKDITRYSRKLVRTLETTMRDESEAKNKNELEQYLVNFQLAIQECEAVLVLFDEGTDSNRDINRAIKRYDYLLLMLNKLSSYLFDKVSRNESENEKEKSFDTEDLNNSVPQKNYYKLCLTTPETVSNDVEILTPYIDKGILRSKRRNILYTTSPKYAEREVDKTFDATVLHSRNWDKSLASRKRSRFCKPLNLSLEFANTIDLEVTTILENLSHLSNTFSKSTASNSEKEKKEVCKDDSVKTTKDVGCGMERGKDYVKPTLTSRGCVANMSLEESKKDHKAAECVKDDEKSLLGDKLRNQIQQSLSDLSQTPSLIISKDDDTCNKVDTPDRLNDLRLVEERINFLKLQVPCVLP